MGEVHQLIPQQERSLPSDIEAEAMLLGALLINNDLYSSVAAVVSGDDFFEPLHQRIFDAIAARIEKGELANPVLLKPEFDNDEGMKSLGGTIYLAQLSAMDAGVLMAAELAAQIRNYAARRRMIERFIHGHEAAFDLDTPLSEIAKLTDSSEAQALGDKFELLSIADLEALPPPEWLVHETLGKESLSIIYGEPGAGKSFVALDMALRVALGMDWHGVATKRTGVLYIAGEGARGLGARIAGWRISQRMRKIDAPFMLIPTAINMLDPGEIYRLNRTIEEAKRQMGCEVGLIVLDTVSRSIPGADENSQETMTAFVNACDAVKTRAGGALLGIHHTGKDKDRGMRGSSVLLGAVDAAIRLTKTESHVTLKFEKQKDAEAAQPVFMELKRFEWNAGDIDNPADNQSTLIPHRMDAAPAGEGITSQQIQDAFEILSTTWNKGKPLSHRPETRRDGRFAPVIFAREIGGDASIWTDLIASWLENEMIEYQMVNSVTKMKGLRPLESPF